MAEWKAARREAPRNVAASPPNGTQDFVPKVETTDGLIVKQTLYGDSDSIVTVYTRDFGSVSALAKHARNSRRRFGGGLEPLHTLRLALQQPRGDGLARLNEAQMVTPRAELLHWLRGLEVAGQWLGWIRKTATPHAADPALWALAERCLDQLTSAARDEPSRRPSAERILASNGLALLAVGGWALELGRCVRSGRPCPPDKAAMVDPAAGGLVSAACGGASVTVSGPQRRRFQQAQQGDELAIDQSDSALALTLIEQTLKAHAGI